MSVSFQLDEVGDLDLTGGRMLLVDSTAQRLATRLRALTGEWFLDLLDGTPYLVAGVDGEPILGPRVDPAHLHSVLTDRILGTEGVVSIKTLDINIDTIRRRLEVSVEALGPNGAIIAAALP